MYRLFRRLALIVVMVLSVVLPVWVFPQQSFGVVPGHLMTPILLLLGYGLTVALGYWEHR